MKSYQTAAGYAIPNGTTASYYYQVKDWLGTAHVTLDAAGNIKNAMDYYPYGKKLPGRNAFSTNQEGYRYQFTGHEFDGETGYQYHGARYYNEELARYMSVDPLKMRFQAWSPYNYTMGNPVMFIDPTGMAATDWVSVGGEMVYDSRVTDQKTATDLYGSDAEYKAPGTSYTSRNGNDIVLGENGHFTFNGTPMEAVDNYTDPYMSKTDIAWNTSSGIGSENPNPFLSNLRKTGNFDFNHVPIDFPETYDIAGSLSNIFVTVTVTLVLAPIALEGGVFMYGELTGQYGSASQIAAWYRVGNTAADATSQAIDISVNGGNWNWGSTIGNLSFNGSVSSALPSYAYNTLTNSNHKENFYNFVWDVSGNILGDRIGASPLRDGSKFGYAGYTQPLFWNIGGNIVVPEFSK